MVTIVCFWANIQHAIICLSTTYIRLIIYPQFSGATSVAKLYDYDLRISLMDFLGGTKRDFE